MNTNSKLVGWSHQRRPLVFRTWGESEGGGTLPSESSASAHLGRLWLLSGFHGDEPEGIRFLERWILERSHLFHWGPGLSLWLCLRVNPDGCAAGTRVNAGGVDLNRNWPTPDWSPHATSERYCPGTHPASEPETRVLMSCLEQHPPSLIVSLHSWKPMINRNGPSPEWANLWASHSGDSVTEDMGYATPGSFGTHCGEVRGVPTLTVEIAEGLSSEKVWSQHAPALDALVKRFFHST